MVRRGLTLTARLAGWLLASLVILLALAVWRLSGGPIALEFATPYLERALTPEGTGITTRIETTQLRIGQRHGLALVAIGLEARGPAGEVLLGLPEVEVGISPDALVLHGTLAPSRLRARSPEVVLTRRPDGSIGLKGTQGRGGRALDLAVLAGPVLAEPDPAHPLSYLGLVAIEGAQVVLEDEASGTALRASDGELSIVRDGANLAARAAVAIDRDGRSLGLTVLLRLDPEHDQIDGAIDFRNLRPVDARLFEPFLPAAVRADLADLPLELLEVGLRGRLRATTDLAGEIRAASFRIDSDGGRIAWPGQLQGPLDLGRLEAAGSVAPAGPTLDLEHLELVVEDALITGRGEVAVEPAGPRIRGELRARGVAVERLPALWPIRAADEARAWVTENITAGRAPEGHVVVDLQPGDLDQRPLRKQAVTGSFTFEDLTIRYFKALPAVEGVDGRAEFDAQTMTFEAGGGRVGELAVGPAEVTITGIGIKGRDTTQLEVETTIVGPVPDALALIDRPPFGFASKLGLAPRAVQGASRTVLRIGLPLHREVDEDEVRVAAGATLREVGADDLFDLVDVRAGAFELDVTRQTMTLSGRATVAGVPLDVRWIEAFEDQAFDRRLELAGRIDPEALAALGVPELPIEFDGAAGARLQMVEAGERREIDAAVDLVSARLAWPLLDWRKPVGDAGRLEAMVVMAAGQPLRIERFEIETTGLAAAGSGAFELDPFALGTVEIRRFEHGAQRLAATIERGPGGSLDVAVDARRLDLRPFLGLAQAEADADAGPPTPLGLEISAREVLVHDDDGVLRDLRGTLARDRRGWREAELEAALPDGSALRLSLVPGSASRRLVLTVADAGELFRALERTRRIENGTLRLEADLLAQRPQLVADGRFRIDDFTLRGAPILARLFTLASLTGIGNLLQGEGIFVDRLDLPFTLDGDLLTLRDGRLSGSQVGLTVEGEIDLAAERVDLDGTLVPIYGINRAIGRIPLIGDFLTGSEGVGAFAATYSVTGPFADPAVSVNPLSALAPGFIRELLTGLREGTLEPPDMPEERN